MAFQRHYCTLELEGRDGAPHLLSVSGSSPFIGGSLEVMFLRYRVNRNWTGRENYQAFREMPRPSGRGGIAVAAQAANPLTLHISSPICRE